MERMDCVTLRHYHYAIQGPGWFPGTPRLGDLSFVPEVSFLYFKVILEIVLWNPFKRESLTMFFGILTHDIHKKRKTFPQNPVRAKYDPEHSRLLHVYTIAHFLLAFVATEAVVQGNAGLTQATRFIA